MNIIRILFFSVFVFLCVQEVSGQGFSFTEYYAPKQTQSGSNIWDIYQAPNGLMYFASTTGVVIYDGVNWTPIHIEEKGRGLHVQSLSADTVLVTGQNGYGYLIADSINTPIYTSLVPVDSENEVPLVFTKIHRIDELTLLTGSGGLYALQNNRVEKIEAINSYVITSFKMGKDLILSTPEGLYSYNGSKASLIDGSNLVLNTPILASVVFHPQKAILFSYNGHSFILEDNTITKVETDLESDIQIWDALKISSNKLAIATRNKGVIFLNNSLNTVYTFDESDGLATNQVNTLYLDDEFVLWIGLGDGIQKLLLNGDALKYGSNHGLNEAVMSINVEGNDEYVRTRSGVLYRGRNTQNSFTKLEGVSNVEEHRNQIWYYGQEGVGKISGSMKMKPVYDEEPVLRIFEDDHNISLRFLTPSSIIEINDQNQIINPIKKEMNSHDWVEGVYFQNTYYLLDQELGVFRYQDSSFVKVPVRNDIGNRVFVNTLEIVNNQLLIGVDVENGNSGLYALSNNGVFELAEDFSEVDRELTTKQVFYIKECSSYEFWVINNKRVKRLINVGGVYEVMSNPYNQIGEKESIFDITCDKDEVWFAGVEGVYHLPNKDWFKSVGSNTLITKFYASGDSLLFNGFGTPKQSTYTLAYDDNELRFNFTASSFVNNSENTFSYILEGFDNDWSAWTNEKQKDYTNIPEGNYSFKVKSKNVYNIEGNEASIRIKILPPWYRSWWAYTAYVLLIGLILYAIYRIRLHQILKVQNIRNRIADDLHDDLSGTLIGISNFARAINRFEDEEKKKRFIHLIEKSAGEAKEKISDIVWAINPEHDDWDSFIAKCRRYASDLLGANEIEFDLDMDSVIHGRLPMDVRQNVWLIYKEIITNIVRHAKASYVQIAFNVELDSLKIFIRDDGKGFDKSSIERGNGLVNIHERIQRCKGKVQLESEVNKGTKWDIEVRLYP